MIILFLIPAIIALVAFIKYEEINFYEFLIQIVAQALIVLAIGGMIFYFQTNDIEIWNGHVIEKKKEKVSCEHSYPCNCREECTGSGENESCSTVCDTCYEHFYDIDWNVYDSVSEIYTINRVDRQGLDEPGRWSSTNIGEPTSSKHNYTNYVLASPQTLFRYSGVADKYQAILPKYPANIYDYYKLNRFLSIGVSVDDVNKWNDDLSKLNDELGSKKQANIIVIATKNMSSDFGYALRQHWVGGKKNDVIVLMNLDEANKVTWADVLTWEDNELFRTTLIDHLTLSNFDREKMIDQIRQDIVNLHKRKSMEDYAYLRYLIKPTMTELIIGLIFGIMSSIGISYFMQQNEWR